MEGQTKSNSMNWWEPLLILPLNCLSSGFVSKPSSRMGITALLILLWTGYSWWRGRDDFKWTLYLAVGFGCFALLAWINPLLPWWIFTGVVIVGAVVMSVILHRQAWRVVNRSAD